MTLGTRSVAVRGRGVPVWALAVGSLVVVGAVAGGVWLWLQDDPSPADEVPAGADYVGHADLEEMRADPGVRRATLVGFRAQERVTVYDGPRFTASYAVGEGPPGLDPTAADEVTSFGRSNGSDYAARIVEADWSEAALVRAVERAENVTLRERTHAGVALYEPDGADPAVAVAVLAEGRYAVGSPAAVRDAASVAAGEADSLEGPLRTRFEATREGYVRLAYRFDPASAPDVPFLGDEIRDVRYVGAAYYRNGTTRSPDQAGDVPRMGVAVTLTASDADAARSVKSIVNAGVSTYKFETENASLRAELERIELDRRGRTATIRYESTPAGFRTLVRGLVRNDPSTDGASSAAEGRSAVRRSARPQYAGRR